METQPYRDAERRRVEVLELRRKFDKMISELVDKWDEEQIQTIKARNHAAAAPVGSTRFMPADEPEGTDVPDPDKQGQADKSGGPEKHV
jgi:hypothetical protein